MCVAWCQRSPVCPTPSRWWSRPSPWVPSPASTSSVAAVGPSVTSSLERQRSSPPHRIMRGWGRMRTFKLAWRSEAHSYCGTFSYQLNEMILWQVESMFLSPSMFCMSREHRVQEGKVVFPLGVSVQGDVVVSVYHMRSTIGGRLQAKVNLMCFTLWFTESFYCESQHPLRGQTISPGCVLIKINILIQLDKRQYLT